MSTTLTPPPPADAATGDLVLRVCSSVRHGQTVRLRSAKCTIGSGPQCTLRLRARGVQPLHCLIVRGTRRTLIRRWSPDTRLNGRAFTDAELVGGDRLATGPIELEVLEPGRLPEAPAENRPKQPPQSAGPQRPHAGPWYLHRLDQLNARLESANRQGRQRARRLVAKLRSVNQEIARLRQQQAEPPERKEELDRQTDAIGARSNDLNARREELQSERQQWETERAEAQQRLRQRAEQLDARHAEFDARQSELDRHHAEFDARQTEFSAREADLNSRRAELDGQRAELDSRRAELDSRRAELDSRQAELEAWQKELEDRRHRWRAEHAAATFGPQQPAAGSDEPQQPQPPEAPPEAPIDTADLFRRMGSGGLPPEGGVSAQTQQSQPHTADPEPSERADARSASTPSRPPEDAQEESIDDYMSRLLERVHAITGGRPSEESPAPQPRPRRPVEQPSRLPDAAVQREEPPDAPPARPPAPEPAEMSPRAVAPERRVNLSAMRELANLSAHTAIDRHLLQQTRLATRGKLLIMAAGLVVGGALLWIWQPAHTGDLPFYAAMVSFLVALLWGIQYAELTGRIMLNRSRSAGQPSGKTGGSEHSKAAGHQQPASPDGDRGPLAEAPASAMEEELKSLLDTSPQQ